MKLPSLIIDSPFLFSGKERVHGDQYGEKELSLCLLIQHILAVKKSSCSCRCIDGFNRVSMSKALTVSRLMWKGVKRASFLRPLVISPIGFSHPKSSVRNR